MKYEWRKQEKEIYLPKETPALIQIPKLKFLMIKGKGNPNSGEFSEKIGALYSLSYAVRMMPKNGFTPDGFFEYTVYPLEGIWGLSEEGKKSEVLDKDELLYTIMIRQPDFVDDDLINRAKDITRKKKLHPLLNEVEFSKIEDGLCVQMLHVGSFDDEPTSFNKIEEFIKNNQLKRKNLTHREIYLSDFRKAKKEDLKTVLRCFVSKK